MYNKKINSNKDFIDKIHELGRIFGFDFEKDENGTFIIINGEKLKMEISPQGFYYIKNNNQKICFNKMFAEHFTGTSCLIEIYVTNGNDRTYCRFDQELYPAPSGTTLELPNFTFCEYVNGKTHSFYSNTHQIETMESDTLINPMHNRIMYFENLQLNNSNKQLNNNFTRLLFGVNSELKNQYTPLIELSIIKKRFGHLFKLSVSELSMVYNEWFNIYNYNPSTTCYHIPFIDKMYSKTLKQTREYVGRSQLPKKYIKELLSIIRKKEAIDCFNNTINYFSNSIAWPYISKYYSDSINYIKSLQSGEEYKESPELSNTSGQLLNR